MLAQLHTKCIFHDFFVCLVFLLDLLNYPYILKEFSKNGIFRKFYISNSYKLPPQSAVQELYVYVHVLTNNKFKRMVLINKETICKNKLESVGPICFQFQDTGYISLDLWLRSFEFLITRSKMIKF